MKNQNEIAAFEAKVAMTIEDYAQAEGLNRTWDDLSVEEMDAYQTPDRFEKVQLGKKNRGFADHKHVYNNYTLLKLKKKYSKVGR